jgi:hypothetical protein
MKYVKGFKFDRTKIAHVFAEVESSNDPEVDVYIPIIKDLLNRDGYEYVALAWEHNVPKNTIDSRFALVIVLDTGDDEEELRKRDLGVLDSSIEAARIALTGPDVWESCE